MWYVVLKRRHFAKAMTYRIIASAITAMIAFLVTGSLVSASIIAPVDFCVKMVFYYIHERFWMRSEFGMIRKK